MKEIYKKIAKCKNEFAPILKDKNNPFTKSKYASINALLETVEPTLRENGLMALQPINDNMVKCIIVDIESGETMESSLKLTENPDPQKIGSQITYFRRYLLQSMLGLSADDDDGNKSKPKQEKKDKFPEGNFKKAVQFIKDGGNIEDVQKKYIIDEETKKRILKAAEL